MKLSLIHSKLKIKHGNFDDEFPEQRMATKYLTGNEKYWKLEEILEEIHWLLPKFYEMVVAQIMILIW